PLCGGHPLHDDPCRVRYGPDKPCGGTPWIVPPRGMISNGLLSGLRRPLAGPTSRGFYRPEGWRPPFHWSQGPAKLVGGRHDRGMATSRVFQFTHSAFYYRPLMTPVEAMTFIGAVAF